MKRQQASTRCRSGPREDCFSTGSVCQRSYAVQDQWTKGTSPMSSSSSTSSKSVAGHWIDSTRPYGSDTIGADVPRMPQMSLTPATCLCEGLNRMRYASSGWHNSISWAAVLDQGQERRRRCRRARDWPPHRQFLVPTVAVARGAATCPVVRTQLSIDIGGKAVRFQCG